jgi:hypothetical protein
MLFLLIIISATLPTGAHAFGLFKYTWDAISNQLGLDRGPIPKVMPKHDPIRCDKYGDQIPKHVYYPSFHLQADGF